MIAQDRSRYIWNLMAEKVAQLATRPRCHPPTLLVSVPPPAAAPPAQLQSQPPLSRLLLSQPLIPPPPPLRSPLPLQPTRTRDKTYRTIREGKNTKFKFTSHELEHLAMRFSQEEVARMRSCSMTTIKRKWRMHFEHKRWPVHGKKRKGSTTPEMESVKSPKRLSIREHHHHRVASINFQASKSKRPRIRKLPIQVLVHQHNRDEKLVSPRTYDKLRQMF